ncbi:hypothetical protein [Bacillus thuringiensis]|uniref:hypothetical protein n=1 Tax=Bacillus thuringiensis TaxID=1428 RepID=UPI000BFA26AD|nr:hypothetical protein [Bacillus thuringiensis]PFC01838.1 hypothetical protein CN302_09925 [Bacillus thuringiensis]
MQTKSTTIVMQKKSHQKLKEKTIQQNTTIQNYIHKLIIEDIQDDKRHALVSRIQEIKDEEFKTITIHMLKETHKELKNKAIQHNCTLKRYVTCIINTAIK